MLILGFVDTITLKHAFLILGGMIIICTFWIVTENGTHSHYTMTIGAMLESLMKAIMPKPDGIKTNSEALGVVGDSKKPEQS
jgi:hypothetical protein